MHSCPVGLPVCDAIATTACPTTLHCCIPTALCAPALETRNRRRRPFWTLFRSQPAFRNETAAFRTKRDPSTRDSTCRRKSGALLALEMRIANAPIDQLTRATDGRHDKRICDSDSDQRDTRGRDRCSRCARHADRGRQHRGTYYAFDDTCTHEQCSLAEGDLAGTTVTCMCHGAEFDVRTGEVLAPPAPMPVKVYRTRVEGDALQIEV